MVIQLVVWFLFLCQCLLSSEALTKAEQPANAKSPEDTAPAHRDHNRKSVAIGKHGDSKTATATRGSPKKVVPDQKRKVSDKKTSNDSGHDRLVKKAIDSRGDFVPGGQHSEWKRSMPADAYPNEIPDDAVNAARAQHDRDEEPPRSNHHLIRDFKPHKVNTTGKEDSKVSTSSKDDKVTNSSKGEKGTMSSKDRNATNSNKDLKVPQSTGQLRESPIYGPKPPRKKARIRHHRDQEDWLPAKEAEIPPYITKGYETLGHAGFNGTRILDLCNDDGRWTRQFMTMFPKATFVILDTVGSRKSWSDLLGSGRVDAAAVDVTGWTGRDGDVGDGQSQPERGSLDGFLTETHRDKRFDLVRLSLDGSAVHILEGAEEVLKLAQVVSIEIPLFYPRGDDAATFAEHVQAMDSRGFRPFDAGEAQRASDILMKMTVIWVQKNSTYAHEAQAVSYSNAKAGYGKSTPQLSENSRFAWYVFWIGVPFLPWLFFLVFAKVLEDPRRYGLSRWIPRRTDDLPKNRTQKKQHKSTSSGQVLAPNTHGGIMVPSHIGGTVGSEFGRPEGRSCASPAVESSLSMCD